MKGLKCRVAFSVLSRCQTFFEVIWTLVRNVAFKGMKPGSLSKNLSKNNGYLYVELKGLQVSFLFILPCLSVKVLICFPCKILKNVLILPKHIFQI